MCWEQRIIVKDVGKFIKQRREDLKGVYIIVGKGGKGAVGKED